MPMPNRLAAATSAYLRSAAHQPVEWYPWGEEAFARARAEDRPFLLDVGAVWCHWCHVLDRESYEDPEVAAIINQHFVAVKVDRDERPDVDVRYQNAVSAISGQGGWPLTAFLTPEGKVFYGGTYFPPEGSHGRPGFKQVLLAVSEFYRTRRDQAHAYANELHQALHRLGEARASEELLSPGLVQEAVADIERRFDRQHGGFGGAPKFPHTGAIELLLRRYDRTRDPKTLLAVTRTLEKMARGGVYDQLGGGFHRYAVDAAWVVPHFEKMLYDNAELLRNYVHAFQATGAPLFRETALGIVRYVTAHLMDASEGGFYASQDADISLHDDGDYYTWTEEEAAAALPPEELQVARATYHLDGPGEMSHDPRRHVLFVDKDPDVVAAVLGRPADEVRELLAPGALRRSHGLRRLERDDDLRALRGGPRAGAPGRAGGGAARCRAPPARRVSPGAGVPARGRCPGQRVRAARRSGAHGPGAARRVRAHGGAPLSAARRGDDGVRPRGVHDPRRRVLRCGEERRAGGRRPRSRRALRARAGRPHAVRERRRGHGPRPAGGAHRGDPLPRGRRAGAPRVCAGSPLAGSVRGDARARARPAPRSAAARRGDRRARGSPDAAAPRHGAGDVPARDDRPPLRSVRRGRRGARGRPPRTGRGGRRPGGRRAQGLRVHGHGLRRAGHRSGGPPRHDPHIRAHLRRLTAPWGTGTFPSSMRSPRWPSTRSRAAEGCASPACSRRTPGGAAAERLSRLRRSRATRGRRRPVPAGCCCARASSRRRTAAGRLRSRRRSVLSPITSTGR